MLGPLADSNEQDSSRSFETADVTLRTSQAEISIENSTSKGSSVKASSTPTSSRLTSTSIGNKKASTPKRMTRSSSKSISEMEISTDELPRRRRRSARLSQSHESGIESPRTRSKGANTNRSKKVTSSTSNIVSLTPEKTTVKSSAVKEVSSENLGNTGPSAISSTPDNVGSERAALLAAVSEDLDSTFEEVREREMDSKEDENMDSKENRELHLEEDIAQTEAPELVPPDSLEQLGMVLSDSESEESESEMELPFQGFVSSRKKQPLQHQETRSFDKVTEETEENTNRNLGETAKSTEETAESTAHDLGREENTDEKENQDNLKAGNEEEGENTEETPESSDQVLGKDEAKNCSEETVENDDQILEEEKETESIEEIAESTGRKQKMENIAESDTTGQNLGTDEHNEFTGITFGTPEKLPEGTDSGFTDQGKERVEENQSTEQEMETCTMLIQEDKVKESTMDTMDTSIVKKPKEDKEKAGCLSEESTEENCRKKEEEKAQNSTDVVGSHKPELCLAEKDVTQKQSQKHSEQEPVALKLMGKSIAQESSVVISKTSDNQLLKATEKLSQTSGKDTKTDKEVDTTKGAQQKKLRDLQKKIPLLSKTQRVLKPNQMVSKSNQGQSVSKSHTKVAEPERKEGSGI